MPTDGSSRPRTPSNPELNQLARGLAGVLAKLSHDPDGARLMAKQAGFPPEYIPEFKTAAEFWSRIIEDTTNGRSRLSDLIRTAACQFPYNSEIRAYEEKAKAMQEPGAAEPDANENTMGGYDDAAEQTRALWRLTLDVEGVTDLELERIMAVVRSISGEPSLRLVRVLKGSVILEIDAPHAAIKRLQQLAETGVLTKAIGCRILKSTIADEESSSETPAPRETGAVPLSSDIRPMIASEAAQGSLSRRSAGVSDDMMLLEKWRGGDRKAGNVLVGRYFRSIRGFFVNKASKYVAEDLTQQTFATCIAGVTSHRLFTSRSPSSAFRRHLFAIANKVLMEYYRKNWRRAEPFDPKIHSISDAGVDPLTTLATREEQRLLLDALRNISLMHQTILELYFWEQLSTPQIAEILDVSASTVRKGIRRGTQLLREQLTKRAVSRKVLESTPGGLDAWVASLRDWRAVQ